MLNGLRLPVEDAVEAAAEILAEVLVELTGETELIRTKLIQAKLNLNYNSSNP